MVKERKTQNLSSSSTAPMEDYVRKLAIWHTKTFKPLITHDDLEPIMLILGFVPLPLSSINGGLWKGYAYNGADYVMLINGGNEFNNEEEDNDKDNTETKESSQQSEKQVSGEAAGEEAVAVAATESDGGGDRDVDDVVVPPPTPRLPYPRIDGLHTYTYRAFCDAVAFFIGDRVLPDHFHVRGMPLNRTCDQPYDKKFRCMNDDDVRYVYRDGTLDPATKTLYAKKTNDNLIIRGNNKFCNYLKSKDIIRKGNTKLTSIVALKDVVVL